jgi:predicted nucleotidyltransferase component of viral defense system
MIQELEIKEKARTFSVPDSSIEKDYAQNWLLKSLNTIDMVLKGGTGIRKVYVKDYRFSDDLDFTMLNSKEVPTLTSKIIKCVNTASEESGISFSSKIKYENTESGFRVTIYFSIIRRGHRAPNSIKLDITLPENEPILLPVAERKVYHIYSDTCTAVVKTYALEEILAEKLRALFQRVRPRDLYDLWFFRNYFSSPLIRDTFYKKCKIKNVVPDVLLLENREAQFKAAWENSLKHQMRNLPSFEEIYKSNIASIKILLNPDK